jgi:hypothetical protein
MITTDASHAPRRRWLRRASAAAIATAVLGIGGTGLSVAVVSARHSTSGSNGTTANSSSNSDDSTSGSDDSGSSSSSNGSGSSSDDSGSSSGLGSANSGSTSQGGSHGS